MNPTLLLVLTTLLKIAIMIGFLMNLAGILTWVDRRMSAMIHDRVGPNRAVVKLSKKVHLRVAGLLHLLADGAKFFTKEDFLPPKADKLLFGLAPVLVMGATVALLGAIPFGDTLCLEADAAVKGGLKLASFVPRYGVCSANGATGAGPIELAIAPLNVGMLYVFAIAGQGIIGAAIAGFSSDNKFSLMGALRASSQMVSYEVTLGLSIVGAFMVYGTIRLDEMIRWQSEHSWGIFVQPLAFILFFAAAVAETKRIPFDLPEAESELVSGYFTEYSGMKFAMFYLAEYMEVVTSSMLLVVLFLGGWALPFVHRDGITIAFGATTLAKVALPHVLVIVLGMLGFFAKVAAVCWLQAFVRWSLPRFRYDQLMKLGWRTLLPLSLVNILVTGVVLLVVDGSSIGIQGVLQTLGDGTQALVAVLVAYWVIRLVVGMFGRPERKPLVVGTSAQFAFQAGGAKPGPLQD